MKNLTLYSNDEIREPMLWNESHEELQLLINSSEKQETNYRKQKSVKPICWVSTKTEKSQKAQTLLKNYLTKIQTQAT
jgi:hypothetical protein